MRKLLIAVLLLLITDARAQNEPMVRIGLNQNAATVTIRSAAAFSVQQQRTRSATITAVLSLGPGAPAATLKKADLRYRMVVELDGGVVLALPPGAKVRMAASGAPLAIENRSYRGAIEVFANGRNTLTVVNELPVEEYLLGVVPNELNPTTFGQIEALKAQAVAARTYVQRHLGQSKNEGYDICATDACQVYFGAGTEEPTATRAVLDTRGLVATFDGRLIDAMYTSTCGGRTENAENIFDMKVPYLVSTSCEYKHPEPLAFATSRAFPDWKKAVLAVAGVSTFAEAQRFMGLRVTGGPSSADPAILPAFIRQSFYPTVITASDEAFLTEQGILSPTGAIPTEDLLFRLIDKKAAFEWQQGVLESWDGQTMTLVVNGRPKAFALAADAPIYRRVGDERLATRQGAWVGGELIDFRAESDTVRMLVYRINFANPAADRFSRLAMWQVHRTRQELDAAFRALNLGELTDMQVIDRGPSERLVTTEIIGSSGRRTVRALRLRTLLGVRDSLFSFDIERNAAGAILGVTLYGRGWGHGVGMCQLGAYGMAMEGATFDEILKKYYNGIELKQLY
ncbi:MAG: SpoIID/LytB domain-containing protein [Acidobacteriota bacterium]